MTLEAQNWFCQQKEAITNEVKRLIKVDKLYKAIDLTNTQTISIKKSQLSELLITHEYIKRFNKELFNLGANRIPVSLEKTRTEKSKVYHQIKLKNSKSKIKTGEVLSEGEFRIVSISAFLADIEGREGNSPIIFDDPISSLDQNFEEAVVTRLVQLAYKRQVIVFTHRLSLLSLLEDEAKKRKCATNVIALNNEHWGTGEPSELPLYGKKPLNAINYILNDRLKKAENVLNEEGKLEYDILAKSICGDIRITLERLIENDLLADVIQRFRKPITIKGKIQNLAKIESKDCKFLDDLWSKYSRYEHSQPLEAPVQIPVPDEIKNDLNKIKEWVEEFNKREISK